MVYVLSTNTQRFEPITKQLMRRQLSTVVTTKRSFDAFNCAHKINFSVSVRDIHLPIAPGIPSKPRSPLSPLKPGRQSEHLPPMSPEQCKKWGCSHTSNRFVFFTHEYQL